ncbi:O-antigen ligase domain-containing protein [Methylobacterium nonmethylotrophicum]|uniref:O-antigen ligase domain-containing protein n=2 Tax=Methylobacterium nonmethylotrophicum TaxID=1141884 RepID=A0A4Z0NRT5_9HYPH|nr:O-antigen ligase family protein [Methylobacterium nonmethylotrophicum]TGD99128.1 O-antigen ligase domain-containing protein [Methylobacterium nonmethylotrophicum]
MAAANRSSPVVVGLAGLLLLAGAAAAGRPLRALLLSPLATPAGLAALAFLAWCAVSLTWSPLPGLSLRTLSEFLPALAGAYLVARLAPPHLARVAGPAAWILAGTCLYVVADLASGLVIREALGQRVAAFAFNRPLLTMMLVVFPLAACLAASGRRGLAALAAAACAVAAWRSVSGATVLGLATGALTYGAVRWLPPRAGLGLAGAALLGALVLAPVEGDLLARTMPEALHQRLAGSSTRARVAIARSFGAAVAADPWRGAGYGTSGRFQDAPVAQRLEPEMRFMLAVGHPHNSFLQVWAELGIVGAALAALVMALTLRALGTWPAAARQAGLALLASAGIVAFVEHGAWQAWWTAGVGAAIAWLRALPYHVEDPTDER